MSEQDLEQMIHQMIRRLVRKLEETTIERDIGRVRLRMAHKHIDYLRARLESFEAAAAGSTDGLHRSPPTSISSVLSPSTSLATAATSGSEETSGDRSHTLLVAGHLRGHRAAVKPTVDANNNNNNNNKSNTSACTRRSTRRSLSCQLPASHSTAMYATEETNGDSLLFTTAAAAGAETTEEDAETAAEEAADTSSLTTVSVGANFELQMSSRSSPQPALFAERSIFAEETLVTAAASTSTSNRVSTHVLALLNATRAKTTTTRKQSIIRQAKNWLQSNLRLPSSRFSSSSLSSSSSSSSCAVNAAACKHVSEPEQKPPEARLKRTTTKTTATATSNLKSKMSHSTLNMCMRGVPSPSPLRANAKRSSRLATTKSTSSYALNVHNTNKSSSSSKSVWTLAENAQHVPTKMSSRDRRYQLVELAVSASTEHVHYQETQNRQRKC